jgi:hypothetical protein
VALRKNGHLDRSVGIPHASGNKEKARRLARRKIRVLEPSGREQGLAASLESRSSLEVPGVPLAVSQAILTDI